MNGYLALAAARSGSRRISILGDVVPSDVASFGSHVPTIVGGIAGIVFGGAHPVLGALLGATLAKGAREVVAGEATVEEAARSVARRAVSACGSMALPSSPVVGYVLGNAIADRVIGAAWTPAPPLDEVRAGRSVIRKGMRGDSVVYVQGLVGAVADGAFGPKTEAAVKAFQAAHTGSLPGMSGVVDQVTIRAIDVLAGGATAGATRIDFTQPQPPAPRTVAVVPTPATTTPGVAAEKAPASSPAWPSRVNPEGAASPSPPVVPTPATTTPGVAAERAPAPSPAWPSRINPEGASPSPPPAEESGLLAALKAPAWPGASIPLWQGGLIGLGAAAILGTGLYAIAAREAA